MKVKTNKEATVGSSIVSIFLILMMVGWLMNFQNLWQYWPQDGKISNLTMEWAISAIGVFCPPLGALTGYIW